MGIRNILILFFSFMAVSLVILIILFNLVFKNIDLTFETKMPESAPTLEQIEPDQFQGNAGDPSAKRSLIDDYYFKAQDISGATIRVPEETAITREVPENTEETPVAQTEPSEASDNTYATADGNETLRPATANSPYTLRDPAETQAIMQQTQNKQASIPKPPEPASEITAKRRPKIPSQNNQSIEDTLYQVYLDGFKTLDDAQSKIQELKNNGVEAFISNAGGKTIIKLGTFSNKENAQSIAEQTGAKIRKL